MKKYKFDESNLGEGYYRGFTLIELLAIIVILAIIAVITVPIVLNIIDEAGKGSAKNSAYSLRKTVQLYYEKQSLDEANEIAETIDFECKNGECSYTDSNSIKHVLDLNGTVPEAGHIRIDSKGNINGEGIVINGYNCLISDNTEIICLGDNDTYDVEITLQFASSYSFMGSSPTYRYENEVVATYGGAINIPYALTPNGYNTLGWDFNGDGIYNAETDTINIAIMRALERTDKTIQINPIIELKDDYYNVIVINGSESGVYQINNNITITANAAEEGKKFSHWLQDGEIISYKQKESFQVYKNITYEAVYVDENEVIDKKGITTIINMYKDTTINKLYFISFSTIPEDCTMNKAGIIATNDSEVGNSGDGFNDQTATFVRSGDTSGVTASRYTWTKTNVNVGDTWYVRAYLQYTDPNGVSHTIYGDVVSQTM